MTRKYGLSNLRDHLIEDLKGAYPTKWEDFQRAKILGEDVFGLPKPHPNAVLNLFEAEEVKFAIPFAAYRASISGFPALMSDEPGTVLPRHTLATATKGMHELLSMASDAARMIAYREFRQLCLNMGCVLKASANPFEEKLEEVYSAVISQREGGMLSPPSLGDLFCAKCAESIERAHAKWGLVTWEKLPSAFNDSSGWADVCRKNPTENITGYNPL